MPVSASIRDAARVFAALAVALALIAWLSPEPTVASDRGTYEATASRFIVKDCADLHCFRVLVPWVLGAVPGPSVLKWKAYAVIANLVASIAVYALSLAWGLSMRAAVLAAVMSAFGFGSLYTLFDPFTSDPLMYAIGPVLIYLLLHDRVAVAGLAAAVAVLAKEFAAAPMLMFSAATAMSGRVVPALRILAWANLALIAWLMLQLTLIIGFNYGYGGNTSTHLLSGGYLTYWLSRQSWMVSALAIYVEFGVIWILAPIGVWLAPAALKRLVIAAVPVAVIFAYVQQPDRAFWNFHFLASPLAAMVLDRAPAAAAWSCVAAFVLANLRVGAQLPHLPPSSVALALSLALAIGCVIYGIRRPMTAVATA